MGYVDFDSSASYLPDAVEANSTASKYQLDISTTSLESFNVLFGAYLMNNKLSGSIVGWYRTKRSWYPFIFSVFSPDPKIYIHHGSNHVHRGCFARTWRRGRCLRSRSYNNIFQMHPASSCSAGFFPQFSSNNRQTGPDSLFIHPLRFIGVKRDAITSPTTLETVRRSLLMYICTMAPFSIKASALVMPCSVAF